MAVLVDTSVWIDYFRSGRQSEKLDFLIDENIVVVNELILTELVPFLKVRRQNRVVDLLYSITRLQLAIDWAEIMDFQLKCLKSGINGIGISDLIIVQNARQHGSEIYSFDSHFKQLEKLLSLKLTA